MEIIMSDKLDKTDATKVVPISVQIWNEIKEKSIDMFALPGQQVNQYYKPVPVEPSKLYLLPLVARATCALPSLETAVGVNYIIELVDKYVTVTRAAPISKKK
jgi:hypothetical protein